MSSPLHWSEEDSGTPDPAVVDCGDESVTALVPAGHVVWSVPAHNLLVQ